MDALLAMAPSGWRAENRGEHMKQPTGELTGRNGRTRTVYREQGRSPRNMRGVTTGQLRQRENSRLCNTIAERLQSLNTYPFEDRQLVPQVRLVLELLRDTLRGRYPHLSVAAFAELLLAMDHFLEVEDPPPLHPGGTQDNLARIATTLSDNQREIRAYQGWRSLQNRLL